MASLTGCVGAVTLGDGPSINIFEWTGDLNRTIYDDSDFNDALNARKKIGGMARMTGSVRGRAKQGTTPSLGAFTTLHAVGTPGFLLESDAANSKNYSFSAILSQVRVSTPKAGQVEVSANFRSHGAVAVNAT